MRWCCCCSSCCGEPKIDNYEGFVAPAFQNVDKVFRNNFSNRWEREGAAIAVYHKGELVVDLQAGYADRAAGRAWNSNTRTVVFSVGKAVGALCVAMLVDRGHVAYEDRMAQYWPEFAQNGKERVTIGDIMNHKAGLAALDTTITKEMANDPVAMAAALARQKPNWELSETKSGYHAFTLGWLIDEIVRRCDPKKRSVSAFFKEEIADKYGIDFHVGLPNSEESTVSRLTMPNSLQVMREIIRNPMVLGCMISVNAPFALPRKVRANPDWFKLERNLITYNDPELHAMEQIGDIAIGRARDLARLFSLVMSGDIISKGLLGRFREPAQGTSGIDAVLCATFPKGHGFVYESHPSGGNRWLVGHPGYGGTSLMMDLDEGVVIAYVSNGLKTGLGDQAGTYKRLRNAVFKCVDAQKKKKNTLLK